MAYPAEPPRPSTSSNSLSLATTSTGQSVLVPDHSTAGATSLGAVDYPHVDDPRILSSSNLAMIREQLHGHQGERPVDSQSYAKQLVDHALAVEDLRARDRRSSAQLPTQPTPATAAQLALERTLVELEQVRTQARALARKLAAKAPAEVAKPEEPVKMVWAGPAGGVYGSQGTAVYKYGAFQPGSTGETALEVENRLLKSDVRHLKRRQLASDTQVSRMESELRQLRAHLPTGTPLIATDTEILIPSSSRSTSKAYKGPLMGDAEAEHLLLAGKALSHVRRINRVPLAKALEQQAPEIAAYAFAVPSTSSHLPAPPARKRPRARTPVTESLEAPTSPRAAPPARARRASTSTALNPLGGGAMDDLLQAAAILEPASTSTKRRRTSRSISITSEAEAEPFLSALDLLADQAFTASQRTAAITPWRLSSLPASTTPALSPPQPPAPSFTDPLPPLPPIPNPRDPRLAPLVAPDDPRLQRRISPGIGERAWEEEEEEESATGAAKRLRSPYVKWNLNEDELLIKAVSAHGQRWDAVAAAVPTRSYHQCRQRFLRGLKSGDALPEELQSMAATVKKAVRDYEAGRARNKGKVMSASDEGGEYGEEEGDEMGD